MVNNMDKSGGKSQVPTHRGRYVLSKDRCFAICESTGKRCTNKASKEFHGRTLQTLVALVEMTNLALEKKGCCKLCSAHFAVAKRKLGSTASKLMQKGLDTLFDTFRDTVPSADYQEARKIQDTIQAAGETTDRVSNSRSVRDAALQFGAGDFASELENVITNMSTLLSLSSKSSS